MELNIGGSIPPSNFSNKAPLEPASDKQTHVKVILGWKIGISVSSDIPTCIFNNHNRQTHKLF